MRVGAPPPPRPPNPTPRACAAADQARRQRRGAAAEKGADGEKAGRWTRRTRTEGNVRVAVVDQARVCRPIVGLDRWVNVNNVGQSCQFNVACAGWKRHLSLRRVGYEWRRTVLVLIEKNPQHSRQPILGVLTGCVLVRAGWEGGVGNWAAAWMLPSWTARHADRAVRQGGAEAAGRSRNGQRGGSSDGGGGGPAAAVRPR